MAIKPILFKTEMVRAILDGRKTCTRRILKGAIPFDEKAEYWNVLKKGEWSGPICVEHFIKQFSPYKPRDILYVRETWTEECGKYYYRANYDSDYLDPCETLSGGYPASCRNHPGCDGCMATSTRIHWHPSIHMPKEAARIWLKVMDVRVERLKDMTNNDALKEGAEGVRCDHAGSGAYGCTDCMNTGWLEPPLLEFMGIWNSTIKKFDIDRYGWDASPWVWVIEFERCEKPKGEN